MGISAMTVRFVLLFACLLATGCASPDYQKGDEVDSSPDGIRIGIGYDAAIKGVRTRAQAAEHCAGHGKKAVWYGHDRDGNMEYRCEVTNGSASKSP